MLYVVVLVFESMGDIRTFDHSNESCWAVISCGAVYYAVHGALNFESVDEILKRYSSNESHLVVLHSYPSAQKAQATTPRQLWSVTRAGCLIDSMDQRFINQDLMKSVSIYNRLW